jgi:hypothetical protein
MKKQIRTNNVRSDPRPSSMYILARGCFYQLRKTLQNSTIFGACAIRLSSYLDDTLEVNIHGVGELEGLEVGVAHHARTRAKVLDLLEAGHDLGARDAPQLVHQLDGGAFPVVSYAVAHQHVEFVLVVLGQG